MADLGKEFLNTIKKSDQKKTSAFDSVGTVTRVKDGVAYVHFAGGVDETPVKLTINAQAGDEVQVRVADGKAWLMGNATRPPTDDAQARRAINLGKQANDAAVKATKDAMVAHEAAESATRDAKTAKDLAESVEGIAQHAEEVAEGVEAIAESAKTAADKAVKDLSQVEDVVGVVNWIAEHGTMTSQAGETFDPAKVYFIVDPNGDYHIGNTYYSVVQNPVAEDIDDYYILNIDESVQNYVMTHLFVDDEGLWLIPEKNATVQTSSKKVLLATGGTGHTYEEAGTYIIEKVDGVDEVVAKFTASEAVIGNDSRAHSIIDEGGMRIYSADANGNAILLAHIGYGEGASESSKADAPFFAIRKGELIEAVDIRNVSEVYRGALYYDGSISTTEYLCFENRSSVPPITDTSTFVPIKSREGNFSSSQGAYVIASGYASHAEGGSDTTTEGIRTDISAATGEFSHAEGQGGIAAGSYSHAEGDKATASGRASHAEGENTSAEGEASHAEGFVAGALGICSHAEGYATRATGDYSHAQNSGTYTARRSQTVLGEYNIIDKQGSSKSERGKYAVIIGNGTGMGNARSNAFAIDWDGNVYAQGMAGMIQMFAGATAPTGWKLCDGSEVAVDDYPLLYAVIGDTYGTPSDANHFVLPDFMGRTPVGAGHGTGLSNRTRGQKVGAETHKLTVNEMPRHRHKQVDTPWFQSSRTMSSGAYTLADIRTSNVYTEYTGGDQEHNNMQPSLGINFIICTGETS